MIKMFIDVQCLITGSIWSIIGYEFTYPWINENWRQRILLKIKDTVHMFYLFFFEDL